MINNPSLREIALRIVSEPGFSTSQQGLHRAVQRWFASVTPQQRLAAEQAFIVRWLEDVHAEFLRESERRPRDSRPATPAAAEVVDRRDTETDGDPEPGSVLRFTSASPDWSRKAADCVPAESPTAEPHMPDTRPLDATEKAAEAEDRWLTDAPSPRAASEKRVLSFPVKTVQQPSRKVAAFREMFPELAFPVQLPRGAKPGWEFTAQDIDDRVAQIGKQIRAWQTANVGDESRIEGRERRNAADRVRIAERKQQIRDAEEQGHRLVAAKAAMAEHGSAAIGELPVEALSACGFRRQAA